MKLEKNRVSAVFALLIVIFVIMGCSETKPDMPNDAAAQTLVKGTISDFADAVDKGDFAAFRDKASKDFQSQFTTDALKSTFQIFTDKKELAVPILRSAAGMTPKFTTPPSIREENGNYILVTDATFDTTPAATKATNEYVWRDKEWKLLKVGMFLQ